MSRPQNAIEKLSRGESVEVAQKDGESASGEALPEGWANTNVGEVATIKGGKRLPKGKTYTEEPTTHPYVRVSDLKNGSVDTSNLRYISEEVHQAISRYVISKDDVYISIAGTIGVTGQVPPELDGANLTENAARISLAEGICPRYFHKLMTSPEVQQQISFTTIATTQPKLALFRIEALDIPVPPKAEQSRIVSAIESLQERSSRARVLLSEVGPLIGQLRQSVLRDAFSGKLTRDWRRQNPAPSGDPERLRAGSETASELLLRIRTERRERWQSEQLAKYEAKGKQPPKNWQDKYKEPEPVDESELPELPDGWCWTRFGDIAAFINGDRGKNYPNKSEYVPEGLAFINTGHIEPDGSLSLERMNHISREKYDTLGSGKIQPGDLVYCLRGATLGKTAFVDPFCEGAIASSLVIIRPDLTSMRQYLYHFLISPLGREEIFKYDNGSAQPNLSANSVTKYLIPMPPEAEIAAVCEKLNEAASTINGVESGLASMESSLTQLDQSILSKAFRGELVPQDSGDEPASELLARIRTTREKLEAEKQAAKKKKPAKRKKTAAAATPKRQQLELELSDKTSSAQISKPTPKTTEPKSKSPPTKTESQSKSSGTIHDYSTDEIMAEIRSAMWGVGEVEEDELLKAVSKRLGYGRMSANIRTKLKKHLRAAVRRQIIERDGDQVDCPTSIFRNYEKEFLVDTLKSAMRKGYEYTRDEVMYNVAIHLGFSNLTDPMRNHMKPAIKLAIRRKLLVREGNKLSRDE